MIHSQSDPNFMTLHAAQPHLAAYASANTDLHSNSMASSEQREPDTDPTSGHGKWQQKWSQFRTYYLVPTLLVILVAVAAIMILARIFGKREVNLLYVAVFDNVMDQESKQQATSTILEDLEGFAKKSDDNTYTVELDDSFSLSDGKDAERLLVLSSNHACDVIIGSLDLIKAYAGYGYLVDLDSVLGADQAASLAKEGRLVSLPGYLDDERISFEDTESGQGEEKNYGINLEGSSLLESLGCHTEDVYAGIILECANEENAVWFLEKLAERQP